MSEKPHKYDYKVDLNAATAAAKVVRMVGRHKRVLDLGAGPGSITRELKNHNECRVSAVEIDESSVEKLSLFCEKVYPGNLNDPEWTGLVAQKGKYEVVVAADVLEHLLDPWATLRAIQDVLSEEGYVVVSLPHAGHSTVVACLLGEDFAYREWGLLDKTHIRFFGMRNIEQLFVEAGYKILEAEFVVTPPEQTEFAERWKTVPQELKNVLAENRFGSVYQVVIKAKPDPAPESGLLLSLLPVPVCAPAPERSEARGAAGDSSAGLVSSASESEAKEQPNPRLIAFYLPQYHPIPENDTWWGKGFTEWTNVTKARPLFPGHYQPHLPTDFGFYDLRVTGTRRDQIRAAKQYGIDGFCYHYFWFSGKRLLSQPLDDMLADPASDMPFCLCWANENWTRRWDAAEQEVLIAQEYGPEDDLGFIKSLVPFFADSRYIRLGGAPLLIVYRPQHLPNMKNTARIWREYCRSVGIGEIHLCAALTHGNNDYAGFGFDSGVEFPPHNVGPANLSEKIGFHAPFQGCVFSFKAIAQWFLHKATPEWNVFMTVFPSWDNTARVHERALIVMGGTPGNYEHWLSESIRKTREHFPGEERLVFINAWNEWAEGCHLEPDRRHQECFLEATLRAKSGRSEIRDFETLEVPEESLLRHDDSSKQLAESRALVKSFIAGITHYEAMQENSLSTYRNQRAWRLMIAIRKAYDLWARRGWKGKLRGALLLLGAPFKWSRDFPDQEIQLPTIRSYVPALAAGEEKPTEGFWAALPRKYDVVILAICDFDFRFQRPQQVAAQLAKQGHRVFWISPTRFVAPENRAPYLLRPLQDKVWEVHLRGHQTDIYREGLPPESRAAFAESLRHLYRDMAISENFILAQLPFWRGLAVSLRQEHGGVLGYDCMDEWDSFENIGKFNHSEECSLVQECDVLVVTAERLRQKFSARGLSPILLRNGVDYDFFAAAANQALLADVPRPIVGYFGAIASWIDLDLVYEVARLRPQYSFVLVGQVFERNTKALQALPNVHLLGGKPYEQIPGYLRDFDVCTIPFLLNDVTAATDPVKLYEYLSLGKPVVATDMAEIRPLGELIYIAKGAEDFGQCLDRCLAETGDERKNRRIAFAKANTWASRVTAMDSVVRTKFALVSIVIVTHNSRRYIGRCIDSVLRNTSYPNCEIIVVDNGSTDGTANVLRRYAACHAQLHCEFLEQNRGFAAGNNIGAKLTQGEYLVLLNADTLVTPGWLGRLIWHLQHDASIGLLCPTTNFAGNEAKISIAYQDEALMENFASVLSKKNRYLHTEIPMVPLFCGIMRRELYVELQGLDEGYGIGMFEDDDLSASVHAHGLRTMVAEDCFVHHFGQGSFSQLAPIEYNDLFEVNRRRFEQKWHACWKPHRLRPHVLPPHEDMRFQPESFCKISPEQAGEEA